MREDPAIVDPAVLDDPRRRGVSPAGSRNFRDIGGYRTGDGRRVRWGQVYRSGTLGGLTEAGLATLAGLGLHGVCDLRTTRERASEPYDRHIALGLTYWSRDYETSFGELRQLMAAELPTAQAAREAMLAGYRRLPFEQAPGYTELFRRLIAGELPLVLNCSAGKDRAGTGAALLLTALGVPRGTVAADYALTDRFIDVDGMIARSAADGGLLGRQPPEVARAILGCDPIYIGTALEMVAPTEDAFEVYLAETLGVDRRGLETLRGRLLEDG